MSKRAGVTLFEVIIVITIIALMAGILLGARGGCLIGCSPDYSHGTRVGVVTKFSSKGFSYKTWEGELLLGGVVEGAHGTVQANVWKFTVPDEDDESRKKIEEALKTQKPVIIEYSEWMVRPSCQTDSGYIVKSVEFVKQGK